MATKYVYMAGGREVTYEDAADAYKPEDIKAHWAQSFPELANATWEEKKDGETRVITFAKKVGTKGINPAITALLAIEPQPLAAADLLYRLYVERPPTIDDVLALAPEIETAIEEAAGLADRSKRAINRCLQLKPSSAPAAPTGF